MAKQRQFSREFKAVVLDVLTGVQSEGRVRFLQEPQQVGVKPVPDTALISPGDPGGNWSIRPAC